MNKQGFINELAKQLSFSKDKCMIINEILENNFFISQKNKDKIIKEFSEKLDINDQEATHIYNTAIIIIKDEVKNKIKHPFKSID